MVRSEMMFIVVVLFLLSGATPGPPASRDGPSDKVFSKQIGSNTFVIRHVPVANADAVWQMLPAGEGKRPGLEFHAFTVVFELQPEKGPAIVLASKLQWETNVVNAGFHPLDIVVDGDEIVVPVAIAGEISLWRVKRKPISMDSWAELDGRWSQIARGRPYMDSSTVHATVHKLPDRRWSVEISDLESPQNTPVPALLEQNGDRWEFKLIHNGTGKPPVDSEDR